MARFASSCRCLLLIFLVEGFFASTFAESTAAPVDLGAGSATGAPATATTAAPMPSGGDTDSGTDTGTNSGTDTGTNSGTDTGTNSGTDTGTNSGTDTGTNSGTNGQSIALGEQCTAGSACEGDDSTCDNVDSRCVVKAGKSCSGKENLCVTGSMCKQDGTMMKCLCVSPTYTFETSGLCSTMAMKVGGACNATRCTDNAQCNSQDVCACMANYSLNHASGTCEMSAKAGTSNLVATILFTVLSFLLAVRLSHSH